MRRCQLCGAISLNAAEFEVSYGGNDDCLLQLCRWCKTDLELFGVRFNQIVRLRQVHKRILEPSCLTSFLFVSHMLKMKRKVKNDEKSPIPKAIELQSSMSRLSMWKGV
jgi:hypothetical protein